MKRCLIVVLAFIFGAMLVAAPPALADPQGQLCLDTNPDYDGVAICWFPIADTGPLQINLDNYGLEDKVSSFFLGGLGPHTKCRVTLYAHYDQDGPQRAWDYRDWDNDVEFTNPYNGDTLHYKRSNAALGAVNFDDGTPVGNNARSFGVACLNNA